MQQRAARKALNARFGDARFDQRAVQSELGFTKRGTIVVDELFVSPMEYVYPSTIGSTLFYEGTFEGGEIALVDLLLERETDPVILDIGANIGVHTCAWARLHPSARVFAFEPTTASRAMLARNVERANLSDRVTIVADGLAATSGTATLYECEDAAYNSLWPRTHPVATATSEIRLTTIDAFVRARGLAVTFIKVDVEGFEGEVIAGAMQTLRDQRPALLVEIAGASRPDVSPEEVVAKIVEVGYSAFSIVDGFAMPYERYDGAFENHLFLDARVAVDLPRFPGTSFMRERSAHRISLIALLERELAKLRSVRDTEIAARDVVIEHLTEANALLQTACDARAELLLSQAQEFANLRHAKDVIEADAAMQHEAAEARRALIEELTEANAALQGACDDRAQMLLEQSVELTELRRALDERGRVISDLQAGCDERESTIQSLASEGQHRLAEVATQLSTLEAIAAERGALLEEASGALAAERERSATLEAACAERLEVIERLSTLACADGDASIVSTLSGPPL